ncbi:unnamed protein product [Closterium sp. NIES-54]
MGEEERGCGWRAGGQAVLVASSSFSRSPSFSPRALGNGDSPELCLSTSRYSPAMLAHGCADSSCSLCLGIESLYSGDATGAVQQLLIELVRVHAQARHDAHARHHHPPLLLPLALALRAPPRLRFRLRALRLRCCCSLRHAGG